MVAIASNPDVEGKTARLMLVLPELIACCAPSLRRDGSLLFLHSLLDDPGRQLLFGIHILEALVFILDLAQPGH